MTPSESSKPSEVSLVTLDSDDSDSIDPKDYIPMNKVKPFPFDAIKLKIRNRKLLNSLNTKRRFKDFEYKNYDSTDSDVYEEEDYLNLTKEELNNEPDFLRKRRLERRYEVKEAIQKSKLEEKEMQKNKILRVK